MRQSKCLRIAVFSDSFFPSVDGVVSSIFTSALELQKRGHLVKVFAPNPKHPEKVPDLQGVSVFWVKAVSLLSYDQYRISAPISLSAEKELLEFQPDVIHCHTPFSLGWMGLNLGKKHRIPVVATYHTLIPDFLMYLPIPYLNKTQFAKEMAWKYTNFFYNKATQVTTPTKAMANELKKHGCKAIAISNPLQFSLFNAFAKTKKPEMKKEFRLVYFGRISFEKNIEVILESLKFLLAKKIPVHLYLVGSGPAENFLKQTAKELAVEKNVSFVGILRGKELAKKVASCHVMATASTIETQGLTILEAMSAGLPCVGTDFLAIPDAVKNGKNGFLFAPFEPEQCAEKIEKLYRSKPLYNRFSKAAVLTAKPLAAEKIAEEWEALFVRLEKIAKSAQKPL